MFKRVVSEGQEIKESENECLGEERKVGITLNDSDVMSLQQTSRLE